MSFVHLHTHSNYSFLRGADSPEVMAERAAMLTMPALALTDRNGLYGAVPFQKACVHHGIRPIFGTQLVTVDATCVALAKNETGYRSLCRAITALHLHEGRRPFDLPGHLANDSEGVIIISGDAALLAHLKQRRGPEDLYIEITPGPGQSRAWDMHRELGLPLLATNNVWFATPEDHDRHRLLAAIGLNATLSSIPAGEVATAENWLKPDGQMRHLFRHLPEAIANAARVAEECEFHLAFGTLRLPRFPFTGGQSALAMLRAKTEAGLVRRYGAVTPAVRRQVEHELAIIAEMGYADYFLIVADIVDAAKSMGIPTCGRGSAANSVVSYALELTHVEPLSHNLYFERFLNRGRSDCPDVDIDFSWKDRDRVIDWAYQRYGRDRTAMISTHVSFAARGAVREIAKVMGVPPAEITRITKRLPGGWETGSIAVAARNDPRSAGLPFDQEPWKTVFAQATQLGGFPKHLGIHAGGIVISPGPLTDFVPLQRAAKETQAGHVIVTQWDMYPIEDIGLVKIDLLGNRSLAVINDAIGAVQSNTGTVIDYTSFNPIEDDMTRRMIRKGDTMGCFYVESPSMRSLLRKLDCDTFDGLVAASSIIRPGIASSGMMQAYVERFHHTRTSGAHDASWYLHPRMRDALEATYGVMAYQEDVLKVAEMIAGMSPEDSDGLRKAMSKKRDFVAIERYRRQFIGGAVTHGCTSLVAEELWRQIESFSGYSFCKAHSASYALVSYQAAYLRAHHPAEFMASVLSNYGGYYATFAYVSEAKRMGITVLLPCVNQSEWQFTGDAGTIRIGLCQLQGFQEHDGHRLIEERRRNGPFLHLADFIRRVPVPVPAVDTLIRAGAFDSISGGMNRPQLMRQHVMMQSGPPSAMGQHMPDLFSASPPPHVAPVRDYDWHKTLACEVEAIGFAVSAHPLALYKDALAKLRVLRASNLENYVGKTVALVGWQVTRKRLRTKHDEPMVFITFEDTHALYETVMFPREYRRFAPLTVASGPFLVTGPVTSEHGAVTVTIKDLRLLRADNGAAPARPVQFRDPGAEWIRAA